MKQGQRAEVNTFIQGLVTEASPLNFPPNASKQEENFELFRDGTRKRRLGLDLEFPGGTLVTDVTIVSPVPAYNTAVWNTVAGNSNVDYTVVQFGNKLYFFDDTLDGTVTFGGLVGSLSIPTLDSTSRFSFTSIDGKLIVVGKVNPSFLGNSGDVYIITRDPVALTFSVLTSRITVRDLWGVEVTDNAQIEGDSLYQPPAVVSNLHLYNLLNQSWGIKRRDATGITSPIGTYFTQYSLYPSNSEVVWTGLQFQPVVGAADPFERIYPTLYKELFGLAFVAPKGFFVIDLLSRGDSRQAKVLENKARPTGAQDLGVFTHKQDKTPDGSTIVTTFAGRVFYSGFSGSTIEPDKRSPSLNNYVAFSQLVKSIPDITKCYQEGDPTSREGSDLVDTDGGLIKIADAVNITSMKAIGNHLIVIADNGVWSISGGNEFGFVATNYRVDRLSTFGCTSVNSVVLQGDSICYWGPGGIYSVSPSQQGGLVVSNIIQNKIQRFYDSISETSRTTVFGVYDESSKKTRWVYKNNSLFSSTSETFELVFDLAVGNISLNRFGRLPNNIVEAVAPYIFKDRVYYLSIVKNSFDTFYRFGSSIFKDEEFIDWKSVDLTGVDAKAFVLTGAQIAGDSAIHKQAPYLVIHMKRTETGTDSESTPLNQSSCLFRAQWDWAQSDISNKFTSMQQAYRYRLPYYALPNQDSYDNGFEIITTKNKIRGRGRALALYMETEPLKDCHILGWNITLNGDAIA